MNRKKDFPTMFHNCFRSTPAAFATAAAVAAVLLGSAAERAVAATINVPGDFATIQAAINAASNGDEIIVADGTYTGVGNWNMNLSGKAVFLRCAGEAGACIIDVQGSTGNERRAFVVNSGESAATVIDGFTIRNGYHNRGGAVLIENGSSPTFKNCVFENNTAWGLGEGDGGGAVYTTESAPTFLNCKFIGNHVEANFEFSGGGAINSADGATTIVGCLFEKNSVEGPVINSGGGGVLNGGSDLHLSKSIFRDNSVSRSGGGLLNVWLVSQTATVEDCEFIENVAAFTGGGMRDLGSRSTVTNTLFKHNIAEEGAGGYAGSQGSESTLTGCRFIENDAPASSCGGACVYHSSTVSFIDCEFHGNTAAFAGGGALVDTQSVGTFTNCLFAGNHTNTAGGGLWVNDNSEANIVNSTFVNNTAASQGGALRLISGGSAVVRNSILWSNSPSQIAVAGTAGPLAVAFSNVQGGWAGVANINADPQFVNAIEGDFRLSAGSPSIDKGNNSSIPIDLPTDLDGNPRVVDGDDDGIAVVDMGAYEFQGDAAPTCPGDLTGSGSVGVPDLLQLLSCWGAVAPGSACEAADLTGSGSVGVPDLLALLSSWGPCP